MPSVVSSITREKLNHSAVVQIIHCGKLDKLSERQDRRLRIGYHSNFAVMYVGDLPMFVLDVLLLVLIHHVTEKFTKVLFLADVDKLIRELHENKMEGEIPFETSASAE